MQLSRAGDYALRMMLDLARVQAAPVRDIASRQSIPEAYLTKVVQSLARAGMVQTVRGPHGGVRLARPAEQISLRDVIEAAQGSLVRDPCLVWVGHCPHTTDCRTPAIWRGLQKLLVRELENISVADLVLSAVPGG
ncbi:MAG: Rrf2 family transcriptional regulator [Chloroflexi bacterium]|nr:Rrf2 family transcriptional regulator [Chloroflexota bacterium]